MQRVAELKLSMPDIQELHRGARSIYEAVFSESLDPGLAFRWQTVLQNSGQQHVQTHEGLNALNEFAMAELNALVLSGKTGGNTTLPLTETQKHEQRTRQEQRLQGGLPRKVHRA